MDEGLTGSGGAAGHGISAPRLTPAVRTVVLVSANVRLRQQLGVALTKLRWQVREAGGGAEAVAQVEALQPEALVVDGWLPDLEVGEFVHNAALMYPATDLLRMDGGSEGRARSPRRNELLHALREARGGAGEGVAAAGGLAEPTAAGGSASGGTATKNEAPVREPAGGDVDAGVWELLPDMIGRSPRMRELAELIRMVAPRSATVLIEGETGTGKEVVARAVHRLSARAAKPFTVLNCAAIPESLLEAELFGHTRGAFTGAVHSRTGRIEAAHGGTLFLDEIGEMPLLLQAKILRFLDCGELQRVGENELIRVDVRVIAATHQPLEERAKQGTFRLDLYHRLATFPVEVPPLRERTEDIEALAEHILEHLGREMPQKRLTKGALHKLQGYGWPGNVRELQRVLERGAILAEDRAEIGEDEVRLQRASRGGG